MSTRAVLAGLRIENLAIVDRAELIFSPGLNVLTGETGAGKSVLVGALHLLLGGRAASDLVRTGTNSAAIEALLDLTDHPAHVQGLVGRGIDVQDGEVVVRRVVSRTGRGRVTINGQMATVGMLAEVMRGLIDVSGQHEHVSLLDADHHIDIVDAYGGLQRERVAVGESHAEVAGLEAALDALELDEAEKARREDYIRFQLEEIDAVDPQPGELEDLEIERRRLRNATQLAEGARRAEATLYSEHGAVIEALSRVQLDLVQLARLDDRLEDMSGSASSALAELEDLAHQLGRYCGSADADPGRLQELEDRIDSLRRLTRKHGGSLESVLTVRDELASELDLLVHEEARRADLCSALEAARGSLAALAVKLSAGRAKAAKALQKAVGAELASLSMAGTEVVIELPRLAQIGGRGAERAEITIAPNQGEPPRPLRKIASGGELSRLLLAFKQVQAASDGVGSYVFDEVDTGVGGATADVVGRKLKGVASRRQVVAITHLPQVAAYADVHLKVAKTVGGGRTSTTVAVLDEAGATEELARMLGGAEVTERSRQLARELKAKAGQAEPAKAAGRRRGGRGGRAKAAGTRGSLRSEGRSS